MLGIGEKFPSYSLTATVSTDRKNAFKTITDQDYQGQWKVYFFWPKDFTFVCPTEISGFAKLNRDFQDRDCTDSWRFDRLRVCPPRLARASRRFEAPAF